MARTKSTARTNALSAAAARAFDPYLRNSSSRRPRSPSPAGDQVPTQPSKCVRRLGTQPTAATAPAIVPPVPVIDLTTEDGATANTAIDLTLAGSTPENAIVVSDSDDDDDVIDTDDDDSQDGSKSEDVSVTLGDTDTWSGDESMEDSDDVASTASDSPRWVNTFAVTARANMED